MIYLTNRILKTINEKHPQFSTKTDFLFHRDIVEFYISKKYGMLLLLKTKIYSKEVNKKLNTLEICKSYLKEFIARKNEEFVLKEKF